MFTLFKDQKPLRGAPLFQNKHSAYALAEFMFEKDRTRLGVGEPDLSTLDTFAVDGRITRETADAFERWIKAQKYNSALTIYVDSTGGLLEPTYDMMELIKQHRKDLSSRWTAEVHRAYSAACYLSWGCDRVVASPDSRLMVHLSRFVKPRRSDSTSRAKALVDGWIVEDIQAKTGKPKSECEWLVKNDRFFTAQEALRHNLVDAIDPTLKSSGLRRNDKPISELEQACMTAEPVASISGCQIQNFHAEPDWSRRAVHCVMVDRANPLSMAVGPFTRSEARRQLRHYPMGRVLVRCPDGRCYEPEQFHQQQARWD